jgi:hypothetical protein
MGKETLTNSIEVKKPNVVATKFLSDEEHPKFEIKKLVNAKVICT